MFNSSNLSNGTFLLLLLVQFGIQEAVFTSTDESKREFLFASRVVNEYTTYSDMEVFAVSVPELTSRMEIHFTIESESSVCKQSSVEVYYQYGAPPLPPHQTFPNGTFTKRSFAGNQVLSTDTKTPLFFQDAMPGIWYLGVIVPVSNGVKRKSELGFGNSSSDSCSFSVGMRAVITVLNSVFLLPSDGEITRDKLALHHNNRYYRYQHLNASSQLVVTISGCYSIHNWKRIPGFCPLVLSVRSRGLPSEGTHSVVCTDIGQDLCSVTIPTLEQEMWNYFVNTTRLHDMNAFEIFYNISVTPVGCSHQTFKASNGQKMLTQASLDPACVQVQEMYSLSTGKVLNIKYSPYRQNSSLYIRGNSPKFFSLKVPMNHVGSMLSVHVSYQSGMSDILICLQKDFAPGFYKNRYYDIHYLMNCSGQISSVSPSDQTASIYVPFPGEGIWYTSLYARSDQSYYSDIVEFYAEIQACSNDCNNHGSCEIQTKADIVYGLCSCYAGYKGWACDEDRDVDLARVLLLTLSNVAFLVDAVIALRKKLYPETTVYLFLLIISTLYHLCGSGVVCALDEPFLQLCYLFAILLSVWVTLIVLTNHRLPAFTSTLNMLAVLVLFVSVRKANDSILPVTLTVCFGILLVIVYNVSLKCQGKPTASFTKKRWALFILPATIMVVMSFIIFAFLETEDNYKYLHSVAHVLLGFGIALLLPNHRGYARSGHYDMTREFDEETSEVNSRSHLVNEVRHV